MKEKYIRIGIVVFAPVVMSYPYIIDAYDTRRDYAINVEFGGAGVKAPAVLDNIFEHGKRYGPDVFWANVTVSAQEGKHEHQCTVFLPGKIYRQFNAGQPVTVEYLPRALNVCRLEGLPYRRKGLLW